MNRYWRKIVKTVSFFSILLVCFFAFTTLAQGETILTKKQTAEYLDKISVYEMNKVTNPTYGSVGGEWLIMGLSRYESLTKDYLNIYLNNLREEVEKTKGVLSERKYTEYARVVLALTAVGADPQDFSGYNLLQPLAELDNVIKSGLNGVTFALLAFDSGSYDIPDTKTEYAGAKATREKLISILLNAQLDDGGWAYAGSKSDTDMTAMALQALGKYHNQDKVKTAIAQGVKYLSSKQNNSGAFSSGVTENCESTAQVLTAMMTLGIDVSDRRFVKNGNTVLDGLLQYYKDGGFQHTKSSFVSQMSTEQAMYGLTAYYRSLTDEKGLYDMKDNTKYKEVVKKSSKRRQTKRKKSERKKKVTEAKEITKEKKKSSTGKRVDKNPESTEKISDNTKVNLKNNEKTKQEGTGRNHKGNKEKTNQYEGNNVETPKESVEEISEKTGDKNSKIWGIIFGALALVGAGILLCKKNRLFLLMMTVCVLFSGCGKDTDSASVGKCIILVECSTILEHMDDLDTGLKGHIPKDGMILKKQEVSFEKGDSVYDVLSKELKKNKILLEVSFTGKSAYVEGIDNIYEFSCGELSGWMYSVNGEYSQVSCSDYQVKDGDEIQWHYTCDLGEDVKTGKSGEK